MLITIKVTGRYEAQRNSGQVQRIVMWCLVIFYYFTNYQNQLFKKRVDYSTPKTSSFQ